MAEGRWAARLLGNVLIAAGGCIAGLSGSCASLLIFFGAVGGQGSLQGLAEPLGGMGLPIGLGASVVLIGRVLAGFTPVRFLGWGGVFLGLALGAAAVYLAAVRPNAGPAIGIFGMSWTSSLLLLDLLSGVALFAVSVWELRRR